MGWMPGHFLLVTEPFRRSFFVGLAFGGLILLATSREMFLCRYFTLITRRGQHIHPDRKGEDRQ